MSDLGDLLLVGVEARADLAARLDGDSGGKTEDLSPDDHLLAAAKAPSMSLTSGDVEAPAPPRLDQIITPAAYKARTRRP